MLADMRILHLNALHWKFNFNNGCNIPWEQTWSAAQPNPKTFYSCTYKKMYLLSVAVCLAWLGLICKLQKKLELGTDEAMARMWTADAQTMTALFECDTVVLPVYCMWRCCISPFVFTPLRFSHLPQPPLCTQQERLRLVVRTIAISPTL